MNRCRPVYTSVSCNHFAYTARTSGSVKGQCATICPLSRAWNILTVFSEVGVPGYDTKMHSRDLRSVEYLFIAITPRSTLTC